MWILTLLLGSLFLVPLWYYQRVANVTFIDWLLKIMPLTVFANLFYWHAFKTAPSFVSARYLMSVMTHTIGWMLIIFIFKEPITIKQIVAVGLILLGGWLLK